MLSVPRSFVSTSIDQLLAPTSPRRGRTEPPVRRPSNSKLLPETYQDGGEGVCLEFTTSSPTTSTQPAPPVSSRMVLTAHAYHAFPKHTKPPKLDSAKSPKDQGARFSAPSNSLPVLLSSWAVLPCRSLDANNVRKQGILIITHGISTQPCSLHPITKFAACSTWEIEGSGAPHRAGQRRRDG